MYKVLTGTAYGYTTARLCGISHETYVAKNPSSFSPLNHTLHGLGVPVTNSITNEVGLLIDTELRADYLPYLAEVHANRLVDVAENDGWVTVEEVAE